MDQMTFFITDHLIFNVTWVINEFLDKDGIIPKRVLRKLPYGRQGFLHLLFVIDLYDPDPTTTS